MEENTSLNQEAIETEVNDTQENDDENLFSDTLDSLKEENHEETEPTEKVEEAETPIEEKTAPFLEIKYNKETKGLTQDEARELAQKGMNYGHIAEKYNNLKNSLETLARLNNMDVNSFLNSLNDIQVKVEESKELDALKTKYPDANEELLKELASKNVSDRLNSQIQKFEDERTANNNAVQERAQQDIETLKTEYGLTNEDIDNLLKDKDFMDSVQSTNSAVISYLKIQHDKDVKALSEAQSKAKVVEQNETNKKKSLGNLSNAGEDKEGDAFFAGLNSI